MSAFLLLLGAVLASASPKAVLVEPAPAAAPVSSVPPLLLGDLSSPTNPVTLGIDLQTQALTDLILKDGSRVEVKNTLKTMSEGSPAQKLAAGVLTRTMAGERAHGLEKSVAHKNLERLRAVATGSAGARGAKLGLELLDQAARRDPAVDRIFDKSEAKPSIDVEGMELKRENIRDGGKKAEFLGAGEFGRVFAHPRAEGAILKTVSYGFEILAFTNVRPQDTVNEDRDTTTALAEAGAGPRFFGIDSLPDTTADIVTAIRNALGRKPVVYRRPLTAKERVYGHTLQRLDWDRKFGEEEYRLVMEMLDRMALGRISVDDMRFPNIMIGRTLLDPARRAYIIDGGKTTIDTTGASTDELRQRLQTQPTITKVLGPAAGMQPITKPFDYLLKESLEKSKEKTRWQRFKRAIAESFDSAQFPAR